MVSAASAVAVAGVPTVGVEEEFHLVDSSTGLLVPRSVEVLAPLRDERFESELRRSMVETRTDVCTDLGQLRIQLTQLRRQLADAAARAGCRLLATGTAPLGRAHDQPTSPGSRYARISDLHRELVLDSAVCGTHVHVGVANRDLAVEVLNRVRHWLPTLRAVAASSPYLEGHDTGYASFRSVLWRQWPTAGEPETFTSAAHYDRVVADLVASGAILDAGQIYWDVRLSAAHPTLEFRVADASPRIGETVLQAALCRGLVMSAIAAHERGEPAPQHRPELLRAATWHAARYGLDGDLLDLDRSRPSAARAQVRTLLALLRPALQAAGDWEEAGGLVSSVLHTGNSAQRQRHTCQQAAGDLRAVIDAAAVETAAGDVPPDASEDEQTAG